jgi:hypothetical protein
MNTKILFGLFVILLLVFSGCGSQAEPETPDEPTVPMEPVVTEPEPEVVEEIIEAPAEPVVDEDGEEVLEGMTETIEAKEMDYIACDETFTLAVVNKGGCTVEESTMHLKVKKVSSAEFEGLLFTYVSQSKEEAKEQSPGSFEEGQVKEFSLDLSKHESLMPLKSVQVTPLTKDEAGNTVMCLNQRINYPFKNCESEAMKMV